MEKNIVNLVAVGDVGPKRENADEVFDLTRSILRKADITFGQLESNLSTRGTPQVSMGLGSIAHPRMAKVFANAGFDVMSFASNHSLDWSEEALFDTLDVMKENNIQVIGAGRNLDEARKPAIIQRENTTIGFLAYCSVVPKGFDAGKNKSGVAPVRAFTSYEQADWQPGTPPRIHTKVFPEDLNNMVEDIKALKSQVDVLVLSMHWGVHFVPSMIAQYQFEAGHAAIDAGADIIIGTHAHILKGIEVYKGKAIFFSLCNFNMDLPITGPVADAMAKSQGRPAMTSVTLDGQNRCQIGHYSWEVDPEYPSYAFPVDSQKSILVRCKIVDGSIRRISFQPLWMTKAGQPEPLSASDPRNEDVLGYIKYLCQDQGLDTTFVRDGDEIVVQTG
ncbi:MAG: CapA family protein [Proteobacteria bacterium]|nr:CapA family protein [Desulfobacula sp.]MBU3950723.1 CapA family protein [Pseudomonadota bacterium]